MYADRGRRIVALLVTAMVVLTGCTSSAPDDAASSPTPAPSVAPSPTTRSGLRVGIVLPPPQRLAAVAEEQTRLELARSRRASGRDIVGWQVVQPDAPVFTTDVVTLLAEQDNDLVCALGPGAAEAVLAVAPSFPRTRFCVIPASLEPAPPNVLSVDLRVQETAFLAGAAAGAVSGDRPPGFVAASTGYAIDRRRRAFIEGMAAGGAQATAPFIAFPADDAETAEAFAADQIEQGVRVITTFSGSADAGVLAAAQAEGGLVVGRLSTLAPDLGDAPPPSAVLMTLSERLDLAMAPVLEQATGEWRGGIVSVGLAEGALAIGPGGSPRWPGISGIVGRLRDDIRAGDLVPLSGS